MNTQIFLRRLVFYWVASDGDAIIKLVGDYVTKSKIDLIIKFDKRYFGIREPKSLLDRDYMLDIIKEKMIKRWLKKNKEHTHD